MTPTVAFLAVLWAATHLGLSQAAVSRRMSGMVPFELDEIESIAGLLDVPVATLMGTAA